jgi:hypothetical protein
MKPDHEYGLLIDRVNNHGTDYAELRVVRRERDREHSVSCPSDGELFAGYGTPKHLLGLALDGLGIYGFVSEGKDPAFIGCDVEFRNVYATDEIKLARMLKAIKRVNARIEKDKAREPGDKFASLAAALKLSFAVERIARRGNGDTADWRWMSNAEGRNRYRQMIEEAVASAIARRAA